MVCALPRTVEGCTCAQLTLCSVLPSVEAIFVARAEVLESKGGNQRTRLHITEVFKGTMARTIEVRATGLGGSCDYQFTHDAVHLVYASRDRAGRWKVSSCSRTATADHARDDLAALAALREKPARAGLLAGTLDPARVRTYCDGTRRRE